MSQMLPGVGELRATQKEGSEGEGMNDADCTELNATQGHEADIKEHVDGAQQAKTTRRNKMEGNDADPSRMDKVERKSWPEITEL